MAKDNSPHGFSQTNEHRKHHHSATNIVNKSENHAITGTRSHEVKMDSTETAEYDVTSQTATPYQSLMSEIKDKFPEFKNLDNTELEIVLKLYDDHLNSPFIISNPAYYVSGAMILLVSFMFVNAQSLKDPHIDHIGLTA